MEEGRPSDAVGKLDLMIGHAPKQKVVALPVDKEFRAEMATGKKKAGAGDEFLASKAGDALARLRAMNE